MSMGMARSALMSLTVVLPPQPAIQARRPMAKEMRICGQ
jgi:hypothetical protein